MVLRRETLALEAETEHFTDGGLGWLDGRLHALRQIDLLQAFVDTLACQLVGRLVVEGDDGIR